MSCGEKKKQFSPTESFYEVEVNNPHNFLKSIFYTEDENEFGYSLERDFAFPPKIPKKPKIFHFVGRKTIKIKNFFEYFSQNQSIKIKLSEQLNMDQLNEQKTLLTLQTIKIFFETRNKSYTLHTVQQLKQSTWLASYSNYHAGQRTKAKSKFEEHFYKNIKQCFPCKSNRKHRRTYQL